MAQSLRIGAMAGFLATASMVATPAYSADIPTQPVSAKHNALYTQFDMPLPGESADEAGDYYRWGRWGGYRRYRGRRGVRVGDVLAGVAIIGGIAAIASAANNNDSRRDRRRDRDQDRELEELREENREQQRELEYLRSRGVEVERYRGTSGADRLPETQVQSTAPIGIDGAIDTCSEAASRNGAVEDVSGVERTGNSWSVRGTVEGGEPFSCRITTGGQIEALSFGEGFRNVQSSEEYGRDYDRSYNQGYTARAEGQLSDNSYSSARYAMEQRGDAREPLAARYGDARGTIAQAQPAYPGGPIPGETIPETIDGDS
ncbi:MAG: hypothetical protein AAGK17_01720 [Pseudomonadota bacterium]